MKLPKIICVACSKGGVGKSTVAINLAVALTSKYTVRLLDLDYQRSVSIWNTVRADDKKFQVITAEKDKDVKSIIKVNKEILIIDTGAFDSAMNRIALLLSDLVLTPTTASPLDLYGLLMFRDVIQDIKTARKKFKVRVIANKIAPQTKAYQDIKAFVEQHDKHFGIAKAHMTNKKDYMTAFEKGLGVTELKRSTTADEIKKLVKEIETWLK